MMLRNSGDLSIGDLILAKELIQHDLDARGLGFERGEVPYSTYHVLQSDEELLAIAQEFQPDAGRLRTGRVLTGDQFLTSAQEASWSYLTDELAGDAVEMEGAAVALVATLNKMPFLVARTISDRADGDASTDFEAFLPLASKNSLSLVQHILGAL